MSFLRAKMSVGASEKIAKFSKELAIIANSKDYPNSLPESLEMIKKIQEAISGISTTKSGLGLTTDLRARLKQVEGFVGDSSSEIPRAFDNRSLACVLLFIQFARTIKAADLDLDKSYQKTLDEYADHMEKLYEIYRTLRDSREIKLKSDCLYQVFEKELNTPVQELLTKYHENKDFDQFRLAYTHLVNSFLEKNRYEMQMLPYTRFGGDIDLALLESQPDGFSAVGARSYLLSVIFTLEHEINEKLKSDNKAVHAVYACYKHSFKSSEFYSLQSQYFQIRYNLEKAVTGYLKKKHDADKVKVFQDLQQALHSIPESESVVIKSSRMLRILFTGYSAHNAVLLSKKISGSESGKILSDYLMQAYHLVFSTNESCDDFMLLPCLKAYDEYATNYTQHHPHSTNAMSASSSQAKSSLPFSHNYPIELQKLRLLSASLRGENIKRDEVASLASPASVM